MSGKSTDYGIRKELIEQLETAEHASSEVVRLVSEMVTESMADRLLGQAAGCSGQVLGC